MIGLCTGHLWLLTRLYGTWNDKSRSGCNCAGQVKKQVKKQVKTTALAAPGFQNCKTRGGSSPDAAASVVYLLGYCYIHTLHADCKFLVS